MCEQLDELVSKAIAGEVSKYAEQYAAKMRETQPKKLLKYKEECDMFGINNGTIRNWAAEGLLKIINIGGRRYISADSINKLI